MTLTVLFPLVPAKQLLERRNGSNGGWVADSWQPPGPVKHVLADLLTVEAGPASRESLPRGLSALAVARRVRTGDCGVPRSEFEQHRAAP